jgi:hypothetical protein
LDGSRQVGERRHAQFLLASCVQGGHMVLIHFQQHKSATEVSAEPLPRAVAEVLGIDPWGTGARRLTRR